LRRPCRGGCACRRIATASLRDLRCGHGWRRACRSGAGANAGDLQSRGGRHYRHVPSLRRVQVRSGHALRAKGEIEPASPRPPGRGWRRVRPQAELEEPILAELFSVERLEQHARTLAAAQVVTDTPRRGRAVGPRIAENGRVLLESYRVLASAIKDERSITRRRMLVDNFHVVDEQLREIRDDLPPDYYRGSPSWPKAISRATRGFWSRLGLHRAHGQPLRTGEPAGAWYVPTRRRAAHDRRAMGDRDQPPDPPRRQPPRIRGGDRAKPGSEAEGGRARRRPSRPRHGQPGGRGGRPAPALARDAADAARVQLFQRLRDQDPAVTPVLRWQEGFLRPRGPCEEMVRLEHQRQRR